MTKQKNKYGIYQSDVAYEEYVNIKPGSFEETEFIVWNVNKSHHITGTAKNNRIFGSNKADYINGGDGNDMLFGYDTQGHMNDKGNDHLVGGKGDDTLDGGGSDKTGYNLLDGGEGNDHYLVDLRHNGKNLIKETITNGSENKITVAAYNVLNLETDIQIQKSSDGKMFRIIAKGYTSETRFAAGAVKEIVFHDSHKFVKFVWDGKGYSKVVVDKAGKQVNLKMDTQLTAKPQLTTPSLSRTPSGMLAY